MWMKKVLVYLVVLSGTLSAQTFELTIQNQRVVGSEFLFDIYMNRTGTEKIYLAYADLKLTFNEANFSSDDLSVVVQGDGTNRLSNIIVYAFSPSIVNSNILIINIQPPTITSQAVFDTYVQEISNSGLGTKMGTFKISTISNYAGSVNLQWSTTGSQPTVVNTFEPTSPWNSNDISANGTYTNPADVSLPVTLTMFTAYPENGSIRIVWSTESELDCIGFNVLKSDKENGVFIRINSDTIAGHGTSTLPHNYFFIDNDILTGQTYFYKLEDIDVNGNKILHGAISVEAVEKTGPSQFELYQNYPNPFNPETKINYQIPEQTHVNISVFNSVGRQVKNLVHQHMDSGYYSTYWDGTDYANRKLGSGIYLVRMRAGNFISIKKAVVVR